MRFTKHDAGKPRPGLLPPRAVSAVVAVLTHGAAKYSANNWVKVTEWSRYYDAAQRHLLAWHAGETADPDSGLPHLAHAACNLLFLAEMQMLNLGADDRPTAARLRTEHTDGAFHVDLHAVASAVANPKDRAVVEDLRAVVRLAVPQASPTQVDEAVAHGRLLLGTGNATLTAIEHAQHLVAATAALAPAGPSAVGYAQRG